MGLDPWIFIKPLITTCGQIHAAAKIRVINCVDHLTEVELEILENGLKQVLAL